jgi:hypothetical protein
MTETQGTLTLKDIAAFFQVSQETARRIALQPGFPLFRHERTYRIPRAAFFTWLAHQTGQEAG